MKIYVTSIFVADQEKAKRFYTEKMGFQVKHDIPMGSHRWLTLVSSEDIDGTELLLEPNTHPAVQPYTTALKADNIPAHSFQVINLDQVYTHLKNAGVSFIQKPIDAGNVKMAILDDECGNLIQLIEMIQS